MRPLVAILVPALLVSACARTETPEEARSAALAAQEDYDRLATEGRSGNESEILDPGSSPGQIDTGETSLTPGAWSVATEDGERMARFGEEGEAPRVTIACEIGGGIDVRLIGMAPQGGSETVYVSSPEGGSTFTASEPVGDSGDAYISVPASDPFINRLIGGNGPYSIRMGGDRRLTVPAADELTSVVSTCDRQESAVTATDSDDAASATAEEGE